MCHDPGVGADQFFFFFFFVLVIFSFQTGIATLRNSCLVLPLFSYRRLFWNALSLMCKTSPFFPLLLFANKQ